MAQEPAAAPAYRLLVGDLKGQLSVVPIPLDGGAGPLDPSQAQAVTPSKLTLRPTDHTVHYPPVPSDDSDARASTKPAAIQTLAGGQVQGKRVGVACRRDGKVDVFLWPTASDNSTSASRATLLLALQSPTFRINQTRWLAASVGKDAVYFIASDGQLWRARFDRPTSSDGPADSTKNTAQNSKCERDTGICGSTGLPVLKDCSSVQVALQSHPLMAATFWTQGGDVTHVALGGQDVPLTILHLPDSFPEEAPMETNGEADADDTSMQTASSPPTGLATRSRASTGKKRGRSSANGREGQNPWPGQVFRAKQLPPDVLRMPRKANLTALAFIPPRNYSSLEDQVPEAQHSHVHPHTHLYPGTLVLAGTRNGLLRVYDPNPYPPSAHHAADQDDEPQAKKAKTSTPPPHSDSSIWGYHLAEFSLVGGAGTKLDAPEYSRAFPPNHSGSLPGEGEGQAQIQAQAQVAKAADESVLTTGARAHAQIGGAGKVIRAAVRAIHVCPSHPGWVYVSDAETGVYLVDWVQGKVVSRIKAPTGTVTNMVSLPSPPAESRAEPSKNQHFPSMSRMVSVAQDKLVRLHHVPLPQEVSQGNKNHNAPSVPPARVVAQAFISHATPWSAIWDGQVPSWNDEENDDGDDGLGAMDTVGHTQ